MKAALRPTTLEIMQSVCSIYGLDMTDMQSRDKRRCFARPRQIAMYLTRKMTVRSLPEIGRAFSRDHTTCIHAIDTITRLRETDADIYDAIWQATVMARAMAEARLARVAFDFSVITGGSNDVARGTCSAVRSGDKQVGGTGHIAGITAP